MDLSEAKPQGTRQHTASRGIADTNSIANFLGFVELVFLIVFISRFIGRPVYFA